MKRRFRSVAASVLAFTGLVIALILMAVSSNSTALALNAGSQASESLPPGGSGVAHLIVRYADDDAIVRGITFTEPISVYMALLKTDLPLTFADTSFGIQLCGIGPVGAAAPDHSACDNADRYWATYEWTGSSWSGRVVGISDALITATGHAEGFSWSDPGWSSVDPPAAPAPAAAWGALEWLRTQQQSDGGYGSAGASADVLLAIGSNRMDATAWQSDEGRSLIGNVLATGASLSRSGAAGAGKLAVALAAHESCWPAAARTPMDYYSPTTGAFDSGAGPHAWAMLGVAALSQTVPATATSYLKELQQPNGGWEWFPGWGSDTNSTALAIQALASANQPLTSTTIISALAFLDTAQNSDGGFPYDPNSPWDTSSDVNSTANVVQALIATGQDPLSSRWTISSATPVSYLLGMQLSDGSLEWQPGLGSDTMATAQAVPALLGRPFPYRPVELNACRVAYLPLVARP